MTTIRKPLVVIDGRRQELPEGDAVAAEVALFARDELPDIPQEAKAACFLLDQYPDDPDLIELWVQADAIYDRYPHAELATLVLDFERQRYYQRALVTDDFEEVAFADLFTYTRAGSGATYFDSAGVLQAAAANVPRFDHNPVTLSRRGLLMEFARTNSLRNNTMVGAVAGTPGTVPTNWSTTTPEGGLAREIVGFSTEDGIDYIDIRWFGTATGVGMTFARMESTTQIVASNGQTWSSSAYVRLVGGSFANVTQCTHQNVERDAAGVFLASSTFSLLGATNAKLSSQRFAVTRTFNNASTARTTMQISMTGTNGAAVDVTLRIGLPQHELGEMATSPIKTSTVAVTRAVDSLSLTGAAFTDAYNESGATVYSKAMLADGPLTGPARGAWGIDGGSPSTDRYFVRASLAGTKIGSVSFAGEVNTASMLATASFAALTQFKHAFAFAANNFAASFNGETVTTDTSGALPTGPMTTLRPGADSTNALSGWVSELMLYPTRLTNAQLQEIST